KPRRKGRHTARRLGIGRTRFAISSTRSESGDPIMIGLKSSSRSWFGLIACAVALFACSDGSKGLPKARLIDGKATGDGGDLAAEQQRKKEMQILKFSNPSRGTGMNKEISPNAGPAGIIDALLAGSFDPNATTASCAPTPECVGINPASSCTG